MGKSDLKGAATKHPQKFGGMFKRKKLSATLTLNHFADPSTNVVDHSVDSSASPTLMPEVNIDTATTKDSVSATETAASTTLHASSSVPEQGKQATDNTKPAPVGQYFWPINPKYDFPLRSFSNRK